MPSTWRNLMSPAAASAVFWMLCALPPSAELCAEEGSGPLTLTIEEVETAGISGFRPFWDRPVVLSEDGPLEDEDHGEFGRGPRAVWAPGKRGKGTKPGALVFDALHRSLLVRFPGAAEAIAARIRQGRAVETVELVLPFRDTEFWPEGYIMPSGMSFLGDRWVKTPPIWHAVAWALRRPWRADPSLGPTFNAYLNGVGYWAKYGAQDTEHDRYPQQFGPTEVSHREKHGYQDPPPEPEAPKQPAADPNAPDDIVDPDQEFEKPDPEVERQREAARMDLTAALTDPAFGPSLAARLRRLSDCGFLVRKWETHDLRYKDLWSGYEWGTTTGGRGILIHKPTLVVTFAAAKQDPKLGELPPPVDMDELARSLKSSGNGGAPTAVIPSVEKLAEYRARLGFVQPAWMPEWQWQRVQELYALGKLGPVVMKFPDTAEEYAEWIDFLLSVAPRHFFGHVTPRRAGQIIRYAPALPAAVLEHERNYWSGWLLPDRPTSELVHPQDGKAQADYLAKTGDWRGNTSYYRGGYCRTMSTMNFNHTSALGALLGGSIIGSEHAMADGRFGLEHYPLRLWSWYDGTTQESIDHYYFAITLFAQKDFADFGPTHLDRMMGQSILAKSIEELCSAYHPGLRRCISVSTRTGPAYLWAIQDGVQHIIHTLSHRGALHDVGNKQTFGMPIVGNDAPPKQVALQTLTGPWAPEWVANMVDEKPIPYEMTVSYRMWGGYAANPLWKRSYLGRHYGIASQDMSGAVIPLMAQWRRKDQPVETIQEVGTLLARPGVNTTIMLDTEGGAVSNQGDLGILQHRNKALVLTSPQPQGDRTKVESLQTTLALFDFRKSPGWEIWVDEEKATQFPLSVKLSQRITIRDGLTYLGLAPLPATDLGRTDELLLSEPTQLTKLWGGGEAKPALLIESFNLRSPLVRYQLESGKEPDQDQVAKEAEKVDIMADPADEEGEEEETAATYDTWTIRKRILEAWGKSKDEMGLDLGLTDKDVQALDTMERTWEQVRYAFGGFAIELGDESEYGNFAAFRQHIREAEIETRWEEAAKTAHVTYRSGKDVLEAGYLPDNPPRCFTYRRVNGEWPYLPPGLDRDTPLSQQGTTGRLAKNGAALLCEPGRMAYLQTEPVTGTVAGFNPLPDPTLWSLRVPRTVASAPSESSGPASPGAAGSITVKADGRVSLLRVVVRPRENRLWVDYAPKPRQTTPEMASSLLLFGIEAAPVVDFNGKRVPEALPRLEIGGQTAYVLRLAPDADLGKVAANFRRSEAAFAQFQQRPDLSQYLVQDWYLCGPFSNEGYQGFKTVYPPEKGVDLKAKYEGMAGKTVTWQRLPTGAKSPVGPGVVNLLDQYEPKALVCAYAFTRITSDRDRTVTFYSGSDDTITIWLNEEKVFGFEAYRAAGMDDDRCEVRLRKGENTVLLKICQTWGGWGFYFRLADEFGLPLDEGITYGF